MIEEFRKYQPDSAWVTAGYTIENYIPKEALVEAVQAVHRVTIDWNGSKWDNPLANTGKTRLDKIKVAQEVVSKVGLRDLSRDLQRQVSLFASFIREANGGVGRY